MPHTNDVLQASANVKNNKYAQVYGLVHQHGWWCCCLRIDRSARVAHRMLGGTAHFSTPCTTSSTCRRSRGMLDVRRLPTAGATIVSSIAPTRPPCNRAATCNRLLRGKAVRTRHGNGERNGLPINNQTHHFAKAFVLRISDLLNRGEFDMEVDNLYKNEDKSLTRQFEKTNEETLNATPQSRLYCILFMRIQITILL